MKPTDLLADLAARFPSPLSAPDVSVEDEDFCETCGPEAPGVVLSDDPRYSHDLTPPPWEPCPGCAARLKALLVDRYNREND